MRLKRHESLMSNLPTVPVWHQGNSARTTYRVAPQNIERVICHRLKNDIEQYLIRWRSEDKSRPLLSWHSLDVLAECLAHVQVYLSKVTSRLHVHDGVSTSETTSRSVSRKRKSPGAEPGSLWWGQPLNKEKHGLDVVISAISSSASERSSTPSSGIESSDVFNCSFEKRAGYLVAKPVKDLTKLSLPTRQMKDEAKNTPMTQAEHAIRQRFLEMLKESPGICLENNVDSTTPSLNFQFIDGYVFNEGVQPLGDEFVVGCEKPCKPHMGGNCGCEYTAKCACLEFAAVDEDTLARKGGQEHEEYQRLKEENGGMQPMTTPGLNPPKRFPYKKGVAGVPNTLQPFYLEQRFPIYECNLKCNCGPICKSRLVQKGRQVWLTIFKTPDRGWGVRTNENLIRGEFIDVYLGEVLTNGEAQRREERARKSGKDKASYLYALDKFIGDDPGLDENTCHVVDGEYMGNVTRFMNHSCEPNCRQYTVSLNKNDIWVYNVAFFAYRDIAMGEELTFDYLDQDEQEEDEVLRMRQEEALDPNNNEKKSCNCGASKCRGYLWT
ncbi:SET domain-containing protein [Polychaeton citri CBS 116435]|uniref:SET domain-containing protein n=1 Tax=Polychaeton citri CBS 116435 TaxID=1314669 RepID=A0A9P4QD94_9PEZI|nr:SET domain-containing protein [Polychaeton citri CBS 116435]